MKHAICIAVAILFFAGCKSQYQWSTTAGVMQAIQATGRGVTAVSKAELDKGKNPVPICKRLETYRDVVRPAGRSAVAAAWAAIRTARGAKKKVNVIELLRPGVCALFLGLSEWAHLLPDRGNQILAFLASFETASCPRPGAGVARAKDGFALVGAVLPALFEFVRWLIESIGTGENKLESAIGTWLVSPPADGVNALISTRCGGSE